MLERALCPTLVGREEQLFALEDALLAVPAREHGLLLFVEDVHWADSATRELLDHLARRLTGRRSLVFVTWRGDELDRRHPLAPLLQTWRRSSVAETVALSPLGRGEIAEMIAAILDAERVGPEFRDLMHRRTEGNPFVLEEMLKEAIDRGDVVRTGHGWKPRRLEELRIPETVRDTILLRFARLDPADVEILQAAAVLGRTFDYGTLVAVAGVPDATVHDALAVGVQQQLLGEIDTARATYRWRHALTQEAVHDEIVLPRRQQIHSRAADVLQAAGAEALEVARHLLGAARFDEAVPRCIEAAEHAEASFAFAEALELLDHALPHVRDPLVRARLLAHMGRVLWMDGKTAAAEEVLPEGIAGLESFGEAVEAARAAGAEFERLWARSWVAFALIDTGRTAEAMRMLDETFQEARRASFSFIAQNIAYNEAWTRLHLMMPGIGDRIDALESQAGPAVITDMIGIATGWVRRAQGDVLGALDAAEREHTASLRGASAKIRWRAEVELAEVLLELGRLDEARATLPDPSERAELQDVVYDSVPQIRLRLADGRLDEAVELAREIAERVDRLSPYLETLAVAVEAFAAAGFLDEAQAMVDAGRAYPTDAVTAYLDEAQGRILLARGEAAEAQPPLARIVEEAAARGFRLVEWRARTLAAEAGAPGGLPPRVPPSGAPPGGPVP